jgi:ADP-ribose pyrophosphatase YjhB (NUDIX family)
MLMVKTDITVIPRVTVGVMVFNRKRQILLLKSPKWHGLYIFPCGHVEFGESLSDTVRREVLEESGLRVKNIKFLKINEFINSSEFHDNSRHFVSLQFLAQTNDVEVVVDGKEATSFVWASPRDALKLNLESATRKSILYYLRSKGF